MRIALANFTRRAGTLLASAALVFAAVFVFSSGAAAAVSVRTQQKKAAASAAVAAKTAAPVQSKAVAAKPAASPAKGMSTGITVHGHWVIVVKNPDGKVTARREFENTVQPLGETYLASLLAGNNSPGGLSILLNGAGFSPNVNGNAGSVNVTTLGFAEAGPCLPFTNSYNIASGGLSSGTACLITAGVDATGSSTLLGVVCSEIPSPSPCSTNLTTTAPALAIINLYAGLPANSGSTQLVLSGSVLATSSRTGEYVTDVETVFSACTLGTTPGECVSESNSAASQNAEALGLFTQRPLNGAAGTATAPVPWSPGQTIAVTVTISFQ